MFFSYIHRFHRWIIILNPYGILLGGCISLPTPLTFPFVNKPTVYFPYNSKIEAPYVRFVAKANYEISPKIQKFKGIPNPHSVTVSPIAAEQLHFFSFLMELNNPTQSIIRKLNAVIQFFHCTLKAICRILEIEHVSVASEKRTASTLNQKTVKFFTQNYVHCDRCIKTVLLYADAMVNWDSLVSVYLHFHHYYRE